MQNLKVMEVHGFRVLTTRQLATMYGTKPEIINNNFTRNKDKYVLEKHYIAVSGEEMRSLRTSHQFDGELKRVSRVYFWTEKGALLHAKSLNTDKAWDVYDYLVDFYFRAKEPQSEEKQKQEVVQAVPKRVSKKVDVAQEGKICIAIQKLRKDINCMDVLLEDCIHSEWESTYIEKRNAAPGMINTFARDFNALMDLKPKILEERYW